MRSLGGGQPNGTGVPMKRGDQDRHTAGRPCEDTGRRPGKPKRKASAETGPADTGLQLLLSTTGETIQLCCLNHSTCRTLLWQPGKLF